MSEAVRRELYAGAARKREPVKSACPDDMCYFGKVPCPDCEGYGSHEGDSTCIRCKGKGEIRHKDCDGLGYVYS